ncbi:MAG: hypothetical protein SOU51_06145 [Collinsella sp.]|nr:hypothetical protein [Collinsella sp.]
MARNEPQAKLTAANIVYLYRLLKDRIGIGKQTFSTHVEEVLAEECLGAEDLGFSSIQELLEAMGGCVRLTIFKGGRIYATVIAQPEWDAALEKLEKGPKGGAGTPRKGNKPWKRKKDGKAIKPVRPKRIKRDADPSSPEPEPPQAGHRADEPPKTEPGPQSPADAPEDEGADTITLRNPLFSLEDPETESIVAKTVEETFNMNEGDSEDTGKPDDAAEGSLAIALTVTYDPYTGDERETILTASSAVDDSDATAKADADHPSTAGSGRPKEEEDAGTDVSEDRPEKAERSPKEEAPSDEVEPGHANEAPQPAPIAIEPILPEGLPLDFVTDVFCPGALLHELTLLYPYGADVLGIVTEYFHIACDRGDIEATRRRASFPIRFMRGGNRATAIVGILRREGTPTGPAWTVETVEVTGD